MTNHKHHQKLTGDTHPPEIEGIELGAEPDFDAAAPRGTQRAEAASTMGEQPQAARETKASGKSGWLDGLPFADTARGYAARAGDYASQARGQVAEQPLKALAIAAAVGFVLAKLARR